MAGEKCDLNTCKLLQKVEELREKHEGETKQLKEAHNKMQEGHQDLKELFAESHSMFRMQGQKIDWFLEDSKKREVDNEKQHDILFRRSSGTVKWSHVGIVIGSFVGIVGLIFTILRFANGG